jgi:hypothetical protein
MGQNYLLAIKTAFLISKYEKEISTDWTTTQLRILIKGYLNRPGFTGDKIL